MNQFLKQYDIVLRTVGPIFVGSGKEIGKKEYFFYGRNQVAIPDMQKFYGIMKKKGKALEFENYMLSPNRTDLTFWLRKQGINSNELKPAIKYVLDCGDAVLEKGRTIQMLECVKNPYGEPYIPGTSLKGMIRTILLCQDILKNPQKYRREREFLQQEINKNDSRVSRNTFLKRQIGDIEAKYYRTLQKKENKPNDAVNDWMQGFVVSDSDPLCVKDLVLCQRVEKNTQGRETTLPILRESIKPGTRIHFTITIDTSVCTYDAKQIAEAIDCVMKNYDRCFLNAYPKMYRPEGNYLYLGGGTGFVSKTIVYSLFDREDGILMTQRIFEKTKVPRNHNHYKDREYGVSPHILKCTKYQGKLLQMGLCKVEQIQETVS